MIHCILRMQHSRSTVVVVVIVDLSSTEYHKMIGFDTFMIFNDRSTDATQCVLDAFAEKGIVVRVPQDFVSSGDETIEKITIPREQHSTFQACQEYLTRSLTAEQASHTWMATHDVDEFLWFDQSATTNFTGSPSPLKQVVSSMLSQIPMQHQQQSGVVKQTPASVADVQSLIIPRLLFGSSGHERYEPDLVINRFTHRFDAASCPSVSSRNQTIFFAPSRRRRRLFNHIQPTSYCNSVTYKNKDKIAASFDDFKSMSKVSSLATKCHKIHRETNETTVADCHGPHVHQLQPHQHDDTSSEAANTTATMKNSTLRNAVKTFRSDARYLGPNQVYPFMAIVHYRSKSRAEFYERACDSRFAGKFFECPDCTPESFFNLAETFSNLLEDRRMHDFAMQLSVVMYSNTSRDDAVVVSTQHCHVEPPSATTPKSWDDYRSCFQKQKRAMSLATDTIGSRLPL
jgi:Glycosyl transferase family 2